MYGEIMTRRKLVLTVLRAPLILHYVYDNWIIEDFSQ
jgi:hypothetical protein